MTKNRAASDPPQRSRLAHPAPAGDEDMIVELVVFRMGDEEFAADISQVREVITKEAITPVPDSADFVEGVINVRGEITVAIRLGARLSLRSGEHIDGKHIVITEQNSNLFGLIVDEVTEVLRIPRSQITSPPEAIARMDSAHVNGVITRDGRLIILLDLPKVLSEESLSELAELRARGGAVTPTAEGPAGETDAQAESSPVAESTSSEAPRIPEPAEQLEPVKV